MEKCERDHIRRHFYRLVADTKCTAPLLAHLLQNGVLSQEEVDIVNSKATPSEKATELYRTAQIKVGGFDQLVAAFEATEQSGVVALLTSSERAEQEWEKFVGMSDNAKIKRTSESLPTQTGVRFGVSKPTHLFTGRCEELEKLDEIFKKNNNNLLERVAVITQIVSVSGLGGIGKTQLAREYIFRNSAYFGNNILWMNAESEELLAESFTKLASILKISAKNFEGVEKDTSTIVKEVYAKLEGCPALFIFDNAGKESYIKKFLPLCMSRNGIESKFFPNFLITSRDSDWDLDCSHLIRLSEMKKEDAIAFVRKGLKIADNNENASEKLVTRVQGFPLAIEQAIAYINEQAKMGEYGIGNYLEEFDSNNGRALLDSTERSLYNDYHKTTITTWKITLAKIACEPEVGAVAVHLLNCIAYLAAENIERSMLLGMLKVECERNLKLAVKLLVKYSMLTERNGQSMLSVHRLVQEVVRIELSSDGGKEEEILEIVLAALPRNSRTEVLLHINHAISVWSYASKHPNLVSKFSRFPGELVGSMAVARGRNNEAIALGTGDQGLKLLEASLPSNRLGCLRLEAEICVVLFNQQEYELARVRLIHLIQTLETLQQQTQINELGFLEVLLNFLFRRHPPSPTTSPSLFQCRKLLADILRMQGKSDEALALYLELLGDTERNPHLGEKTKILNCIGLSYEELGRYEDAFHYYQEAMDVIKATMEGGNGFYDIVLYNTCATTAALGDYETALQTLEVLNEGAISTTLRLYVVHGMAYYLCRMRNYERALDLCEEAIKGFKLHFGELHPRTMSSFRLKGRLLLFMGKNLDDAQNCLRNAFFFFVETLGECHVTTLVAKANLAMAWYCKDRSDEALFTVDEVVDLIECKMGREHHTAIETRMDFALILETLCEWGRCLQILGELRSTILTRFGSSHYEIKQIIEIETKNKILYQNQLETIVNRRQCEII